MASSSELQYPNMRVELIHCLKKLSDHEYQQAAWVRGEYPPNVAYDDLDFSIRFLFDDTSLEEDSKGYVGVILKNEEEARAVDEVISALNLIFKKYQEDMSDEEYIALEEWQDVLSASQKALKVIKD
ncbi:hypothetical protein [Pelagibius sp. Alg239-R121]|uniref:SCO4402 family protein n=1 Tax=Pelagibius sp. Alg239-R121 TaxID=2993448 RepID=UPI0024A716AB|nr:hypothetical protein [Pelagibius sp. Alg239-R121]